MDKKPSASSSFAGKNNQSEENDIIVNKKEEESCLPPTSSCWPDESTVGLSPCYWSHVPLTIRQIHELSLVNGIHCYHHYNYNHQNNHSSSDDDHKDDVNKDDNSGHNAAGSTITTTTTTPSNKNNNNGRDNSRHSNSKVVPLSKCEILGVIVAVEPKGVAGGGVIYVIDDGTGLIDCLNWQDDYDDNDPMTGALPPLTPPTRVTDHDPHLSVGTLVRVFGRIEAAAVGTPNSSSRHVNNQHLKRNKSNTTNILTRSTPCLREIHASLVLDAYQVDYASSSLGGKQLQQPVLGSDDLETKHWKRCVEATSNMSMSAATATTTSTAITTRKLPLQSPQEMIHLLGPDIGQQIAERTSLPAVEDSEGAWRVFGSRCRCGKNKNGKASSLVAYYKDYLLYCHCQATVESLDPDFVYRDTLLKTLLDMEEQQGQQQQPLATSKEPLRFQFRAIKGNTHLNAVAANVLACATNATLSSSATRQALVLGTFRALRKDGILFLLDQASDTYLLISKDRVLEPYVEMITSMDIERGAERVRLKREPPTFLENVPKQRIQYVKRNRKNNTV